MGSKFLDDESESLDSLTQGTFNLNVASIISQNLTPNMAMKSDSSRSILSSVLETSDTNTLDSKLQTKTTLDFVETTTPAVPPINQLRIYAKSDKNLYIQNDAGFEQQVMMGAGIGNEWKFSTLVAGAPASSYFRFNNAIPLSNTEIAMNNVNNNGHDERVILQTITSGDQIYIQDSNKTNSKLYTVSSSVDNTTWFSFTVALESQNNTANYNNDEVISIFLLPQTSSLQNAYDVSTPGEQIVTDDIRGAMTVKGNQASFFLPFFQLKNSLDNVIYSIDQSGRIIINNQTTSPTYTSLGTSDNYISSSIGHETLTGSSNTVFGRPSNPLVASNDNVIIGNLTGGTIGNENIIIGNEIKHNSVGSNDQCTLIGYKALESATTSSGDTCFGYKSGADVVTGNSNTFLGSGTGISVGGSSNYRSSIGFNAKSDSDNHMVIGSDNASTTLNVIKPGIDANTDLGEQSKQFKDIYASSDVIVAGNSVLTENTVTASTGLINGGLISATLFDTTFNIASGSGVINYNGVVTNVSWSAHTAVNTVAGLSNIVYIDTNGDPVVETNAVTNEKRREMIILGGLALNGGNNIVGIGNVPNILKNDVQQYYDLANAIGLINLNGGNIFSPGTSGLLISKSNGSVFNASGNFQSNPENPNEINTGPLVDPQMLIYTQSGFSAQQNTIDSDNYDVGGVVTAFPGGSNWWQIQIIYVTTTNQVVVEYGQNIYTSIESALDSINIEPHISSFSGGILNRCHLVLKKGTTDLSLSDNRFVSSNKFGDSTSSSGSASTTTLQNAYLNSIQPQITTDDTRGSLTLQNGQINDTLPQFMVSDIAAVPQFIVTGGGDIIQKSDLTTPLISSRGGVNTLCTNQFNTLATGIDNLCIGGQCGRDLTNGTGNTLIGANVTGRSLTTGSSNVGIGIGVYSNVTDCSQCVAIGTNSLINITGGSHNIAFGLQSGGSISGNDSNSSLYIGMRSGHPNTGERDRCTYIGDNAGSTVVKTNTCVNCLGADTNNDLDNSTIVGNTDHVDISSNSATCDLGMQQAFKDLYLSGSVITDTLTQFIPDLKIASVVQTLNESHCFYSRNGPWVEISMVLKWSKVGTPGIASFIVDLPITCGGVSDEFYLTVSNFRTLTGTERSFVARINSGNLFAQVFAMEEDGSLVNIDMSQNDGILVINGKYMHSSVTVQTTLTEVEENSFTLI